METKSYWQEIEIPLQQSLNEDITVKNLIIGGGLCGLLTAYELTEKGETDVAVIEAEELLSGVTGKTTAKITSQHGLIYDTLVSGFGLEQAKLYATANEEAVKRFEEIIEKEKIDCDFEKCCAFVYANDDSGTVKVSNEVLMAKRLGIKAEFTLKTELPFQVRAAVKFFDQAKFHPLKFGAGLVDTLLKRGVKLFTNTKAVDIVDQKVTANNQTVTAENIIIATHYPFKNLKNFYFAHIYQERSYLLGLAEAPLIRDVYVDCDENGFTFRSAGNILIFGGLNQKTGHEVSVDHYRIIEREAGKLYPNARIIYKWSAQDCITHDKIPYIGRFDEDNRSVYFATGFKKWGMTFSMVAAGMISDMIVNGRSIYSPVFSPKRSDLKLKAASFVKESADVVKSFATGYFGIPGDKPGDVKPGEGKIVMDGRRKVGVYKDEQGVIHAVKPFCTHMGCPLEWNKDEKMWSCPCHGSNFDTDGNVLNNPAQKNLEKYEIEG